MIFDLDGTLVDTSADLIGAANACFRARGLGDLLDPVADARIAFRGGRAMLRAGFGRVAGDLGEDAVDRDYPLLLEHYAGRIADESRPYPGAGDAVQRLRHAGYRTAICTNKPEGLAETLMAALGLRSLFDALIGADTLLVRKPDPAPVREAAERAGGRLSRSILVGDTETDREAARAAEIPVLLVTFGPDGDGVSALEPDGLLASYDDLEQEVARLIG